MKTIFFAPMRLAPPPEKRPQPLLKMLWELTWLQWAFFCVGWLAWTCDALDFFSVSVSVPALSKQFNKETSAIVCALRLPLFECRQRLTKMRADTSDNSDAALPFRRRGTVRDLQRPLRAQVAFGIQPAARRGPPTRRRLRADVPPVPRA